MAELKALKNKKVIGIAVGAVVVLGALGAVWGIAKNKTNPADSQAATEGETGSDGFEIIGDVEEYLTVNLFEGFSGEAAADRVLGSLSNQDILLEYAGSYDGVFYEDGQDTEKEQVFSLILTNVSAETLEVMQLWIEDEAGETYQFQVSGLPSGGTVLAQELEGKTYRADGEYQIVRDSFGFLENSAGLSGLRISEQDGKIYAINNSEKDLESIQIIYKNFLGGHAYPGGIAYRISLDKIAAGETLEITSDHYKGGASQVTGVKQVLKPEETVNE